MRPAHSYLDCLLFRGNFFFHSVSPDMLGQVALQILELSPGHTSIRLFPRT